MPLSAKPVSAAAAESVQKEESKTVKVIKLKKATLQVTSTDGNMSGSATVKVSTAVPQMPKFSMMEIKKITVPAKKKIVIKRSKNL